MSNSAGASDPQSKNVRKAEPILGVVVISRNEERHIRSTLEPIMTLRRNFQDCTIVLVDSSSEDATIALARQYPISIYRYHGDVRTAAAGRRIGFEQLASRYVLFVDGDCTMEPAWVLRAVQLMDETPQAAVIYGVRRTVYVDQTAAAEHIDAKPSLGGNALYRSRALLEAGCFNPFLAGEEEAELFGRLQALGYTSIADAAVVFTHHTERGHQGLLARLRKGFLRGPGQVLRISIGNGLFLYHAMRFNRWLLMLLYLLAGLLGFAYGAATGDFRPVFVWTGLGTIGFFWLSIRRRSVASAMDIILNWVVSAIISVPSFFERPKSPDAFRPSIELIQ